MVSDSEEVTGVDGSQGDFDEEMTNRGKGLFGQMEELQSFMRLFCRLH